MNELTETELEELKFLKRSAPYREWYAVKLDGTPARFVNSKRQARHLAGDMGGATVYLFTVPKS